MKTIGLIGGMSWESTQTYYRLVNQHVRTALGGLHSAKVVLYSVDFAEIEALQHQGNWEATAEILAAAVSIPLLHIADATAQVLQRQGIACVGLLGTRFTMEQAFYIERLQRHGIEVVVPTEPKRERVHTVIYQELCLGVVKAEAKADYLAIIEALAERGAQGVILGCTEIGLLVQQADTPVPLFDTTEIHAEQAVQWALGHGFV